MSSSNDSASSITATTTGLVLPLANSWAHTTAGGVFPRPLQFASPPCWSSNLSNSISQGPEGHSWAQGGGDTTTNFSSLSLSLSASNPVATSPLVIQIFNAVTTAAQPNEELTATRVILHTPSATPASITITTANSITTGVDNTKRTTPSVGILRRAECKPKPADGSSNDTGNGASSLVQDFISAWRVASKATMKEKNPGQKAAGEQVGGLKDLEMLEVWRNWEF